MTSLLAMIGIMGAMQEEVSLLTQEMENRQEIEIGRRTYHVGTLYGLETVIVYPCIGKVAAASAASTLIHRFNVSHLFFCGMAGATDPKLNVGDVVVAKHLVQHDLDARPFFQQFEVPFLERTHFHIDPHFVDKASGAANEFFLWELAHHLRPELIETFSLQAPAVHIGGIASGDQFISDPQKVQNICALIPGTLCVEMEGAAVAQICYEHETPCIIFRIISDKADHSAPIDFAQFASQVANHYSKGIVRQLYKTLHKEPLP